LCVLLCVAGGFFVFVGWWVVCVLGCVFGLVVFLGCVWRGFGVLSMLLKVTFDVVKGDSFLWLFSMFFWAGLSFLSYEVGVVDEDVGGVASYFD